MKTSHSFAPLVVVIAAVYLTACGQIQEQPAGQPNEQDTEIHAVKADDVVIHLSDAVQSSIGIEVSVAGPGQIRLTTELPGEVQINGDRMAHVTPRVSGVVVEVRKSLGDEVQAGEVLAVLESRELADIKALYLGAVARLELAQAAFEREERLHQQRVSAEQDFLDARNARVEARIEVRSAQQKLVALGFSVEDLEMMSRRHDTSFTRYVLTAPFDGTVIDRHLVQGESVAADTAVFTVADLASVWVDLKVYQKDIGSVQAHQEVQLSTDHGDQASTTLGFVQPLVGDETRTALARVEVPNPGGHWHPGCFVVGTVTLGTRAAGVVVPVDSVVQLEDGDMVVFVADGDGFSPRELTLGLQDREVIEVMSGLEAGETFVSKGAFGIKSEMLKGSFGDGHGH